VATLGVQFAQSLVTAWAAASLMLLAGLVLVRAVRTWSQRSAESRRGGRGIVLEPALAVAVEVASSVRPSAGVASEDAPTRAPPTTFGAVRQQRQDSLGQLLRLAA
jgi:hypothetical protein